MFIFTVKFGGHIISAANFKMVPYPNNNQYNITDCGYVLISYLKKIKPPIDKLKWPNYIPLASIK